MTDQPNPQAAAGEIDLWLMKLSEDERSVLLSSDYAHARILKRDCLQMPNGQWRMPLTLACASSLDMGAT